SSSQRYNRNIPLANLSLPFRHGVCYPERAVARPRAAGPGVLGCAGFLPGSASFFSANLAVRCMFPEHFAGSFPAKNLRDSATAVPHRLWQAILRTPKTARPGPASLDSRTHATAEAA